MAVAQKNALGVFPDLQQTEAALTRLKETGFVMNNVSAIVQHLDPADTTTLEPLTASVSESGERFAPDRRVDRIQQRAAGGGAVGSAVGGVVAGLTTLAFPVGGGAVLLAGMLGGAFYGAVSGGVLGGSIGINITDEQARHLSDRLAQGAYLVTVKGTEPEIATAESVLKGANIQDGTLFHEA
jgi:outer membrane lipoprotein SlyB